MQELVVIFVVALLVFGPKKLPELGRAIGKTMGQLKGAMADVKTEVEREIRAAETDLDIKELPAWKKKDAGPAAAPPEGEGAEEKTGPQKGEGEEEKAADKKEDEK
jgi:Tat protein translocase TatB subunit